MLMTYPTDIKREGFVESSQRNVQNSVKLQYRNYTSKTKGCSNREIPTQSTSIKCPPCRRNGSKITKV